VVCPGLNRDWFILGTENAALAKRLGIRSLSLLFVSLPLHLLLFPYFS
jgi:hypothetical protein